MKFSSYSLLIMSFLFFVSCEAQITDYEYLLFKASNTSVAKEGKFPLMVFLHGAGERGSDLELVKKNGPPKMVETDKDFPFYLLSPQQAPDSYWDLEGLKKTIDEVVAANPIDANRIYLTGLSMGGYATWELSMAYPDYFAAIAPICGGAKEDAANVDRIAHLPVWAFHGADDSIVPEENTAAIMKALKKVNPTARYTVYPEVDHDSWTETYSNPELYFWLLAQAKK